jgi:hypothetical protein
MNSSAPSFVTKLGAFLLFVGCFFPNSRSFAQWHRSTSKLSPTACITFSDSANGLMLSINGTCYATSDGGRSWDSLSYVNENLGGTRSQRFYSWAARQGDLGDRKGELYIIGDSIYAFSSYPISYRNWGEKLYDSLYGFRFVQIVGFGETDTLRILVTHDNWLTSEYYGPLLSDSSYYPYQPYNTFAPVYTATLLDSNHIWAGYRKNLMHTTDGGVTWVVITPFPASNRDNPIWDHIFLFPATHEIYAASIFEDRHNNSIDFIYSSDDGATWMADSATKGNSFYTIMPSPSDVWKITGNYPTVGPAYGAANPALFHSSDKGHQWLVDSLMLRGDTITTMYWLDARHGWIAGYHNDIGDIWYYDATLGVNPQQPVKAPTIAYPNPASSSFRLTGVSVSAIRIRLLDELGRTVFDRQSITPISREQIDVTHLTNGIYELLLTGASAETRTRVVVQH